MSPFSEQWPTAWLAATGILLIWFGLALAARGRFAGMAGGALRWLGLLALAPTVAHVLMWDSFVGACYGLLAVPRLWAQLPDFLVVILALGTAAGSYHHFRRNPEEAVVLVVGANLVALWYITVAILFLLDGRINGRIAGNQAMAVAAAWALYGLGLFLVERRLPDQRLRHGIRFLLVAALGYLVVAALPGNARWAVPWVRLTAYAAVLGSISCVELAYRRYGTDDQTNGLLAFAAAASVFFIINFETERWLEPLFTLPAGEWLTEEGWRWEESTQSFTQVALWAVYACALMWAGKRLRSISTQLLGLGVYAWTVAAALVASARGTAAPWLQVLAMGLLLPGALLGLRLARRSDAHHPTAPPTGWR
ncbi:MAG: hypothetical protein ACM3XM_08360 [Mycobacterium leprae]